MASIHFVVHAGNIEPIKEGLAARIMIDVRQAFDRTISGIKVHAARGFPFTEADAVELIIAAECIRENLEKETV